MYIPLRVHSNLKDSYKETYFVIFNIYKVSLYSRVKYLNEMPLRLYYIYDFIMFCRFYFVGDEDLLEIIGNSKNIPRLQKHFKKMFAGVAAIVLDEDDTVVTGIASKEGEEVIEISLN